MGFVEHLLRMMLLAGGTMYGAGCLIALGGLVRRSRTRTDIKPTVSIIVPARNEEKTIGALLGDLSRQTYDPSLMEILIVDDCSEDRTREIAEEWAARDSRFRTVAATACERGLLYKKRAVNTGITLSTGELIISTDADCRVPERWAETLVANLNPGTDLVAGPVLLRAERLIGRLESIELFGLQALAAGLMNTGLPITCNGANLAYRRSSFDRVGGFDGVGHLVSGDDDLLMQKIAAKDPSRVRFVDGPEITVVTAASLTVGEFLNRRARWASKITSYPSKRAVGVLALFFAYLLSILVWAPMALVAGWPWGPFLWGAGMKWAGDFLLTAVAAVPMKHGRLLVFFPLAELFHIPYLVGVTLYGTFGTFEWRGRVMTASSRGMLRHENTARSEKLP